MAMEERQQQIRERAGLEESRLNTDLIDWLRKWSTPILLVVAAIAGGYILYQRMHEAGRAQTNRAFQELEAVTAAPNPNPVSLRGIAEQYSDVKGVSILARLAAADAYLQSVRMGVRPGAVLNPDGTLADAADALSAEDREQYLREAAGLYDGVLRETERMKGGAIHAIGALFGLAAVAESRGELDQAKGHYERIVAYAEGAGFPNYATLARTRAETVGALAEAPQLHAAADLPKLPWAEEAIVPPAGGEAGAAGEAPAGEGAAEGEAPEAGGEAPGAEEPAAEPAPAEGTDGGEG